MEVYLHKLFVDTGCFFPVLFVCTCVHELSPTSPVDSTEMASVGEDGKVACLVPYHFAGHLESTVEPVGGARATRITQEITTLANSLPLSASSSVFIRCDEERFDVMKVSLT